MPPVATHVATCHCGATRIEIDRLPETATACTCSFCAKRGALWGYFDPSEVRITEGAAADYAPSGLNHHHFCATCGCTTVSHTPDWQAADGEAGEWAATAAAGGATEAVAQDWAWDEAAIAALPRRVSVNLRLLDGVDLSAIPVVAVDGRNLW